MNPKEPVRESHNRRERPSKPALTREGIVGAALRMLNTQGLNKVTMRGVAADLDTGPASLYVYVRNTEDLHAQILDALLSSLEATLPAQASWEIQLKALLTSYRDVLFRYPEMARMALTTHPSGPHYLSLVNAALGLLQEGGIADREAAWAVDLLLLYVTAVAAEQGTRHAAPAAAQEDSALAFEIAVANPHIYPHIAWLGQDLLSGTGPDRFDWALDVLLAGIVNTRRAPDHAP